MKWHEWMNESMNEWNKVSSRQSHAHIADPIFQKWSESGRDNFSHILCESELSLQSSALFVDNFADRGPQPRKERPSFGEHGSHFARKNMKNKRFRARESFQAWIHAFPTSYTSQQLDDDDDDDDDDEVVTMMVRKLAMTILRNSEVSHLNFLCIHIHIKIRIRIRIHLHVHMHIRIHIYIYIYICIYIYTTRVQPSIVISHACNMAMALAASTRRFKATEASSRVFALEKRHAMASTRPWYK